MYRSHFGYLFISQRKFGLSDVCFESMEVGRNGWTSEEINKQVNEGSRKNWRFGETEVALPTVKLSEGLAPRLPSPHLSGREVTRSESCRAHSQLWEDGTRASMGGHPPVSHQLGEEGTAGHVENEEKGLKYPCILCPVWNLSHPPWEVTCEWFA